MEYSADAAFEFPNGLPGFENERSFVFLEQPATDPLMFLQSLSNADVCFMLLPVLAAVPAYRLHVAEEDLATLQLPTDRQPRIGQDILCAVTVCAAGEGRPEPTVNLLAPILVNFNRRLGVQAIAADSGYSCRHPLTAAESQPELAPCL